MTRAVEVRHIECHLGDRQILTTVDLSVDRGELVTLVGPSGCGKSTLLRVIAGLEQPSAGNIHIDGVDVTTTPPEQRRVGLVFQSNALFGHLRVDRNIAFGLRHLSKRERQERVEEMLDLVKLNNLAHRYPHQLSGGEQQRIALARALAPQPPVVLMDEPFGALDEVLREELGWEVKEILSRSNTAAILVTHDRHEALTLGDRVAVMDGGRVLQCDVPRAVYQQPATRFVADFLAVSSYVVSDSGEEILVRPHQVDVVAGGPHTVARVEFLGATSRYTVRMTNGSTVVADVDPETVLNVGDSCDIRLLKRTN